MAIVERPLDLMRVVVVFGLSSGQDGLFGPIVAASPATVEARAINSSSKLVGLMVGPLTSFSQ